MKKITILLVFSMFFLGYINSQTITVSVPNSGSKWMAGKFYNISWSKTGTMNKDVKIRLYDKTKTKKILEITNSTANNGSYGWVIPGSVVADKYIIRVKTVDNNVYDDSVIFSIIDNPYKAASSKGKDVMKPSHGKIEVISPSGSSKWKEGTLNKIRWKDTTAKNKALKIDLYNGSGDQYIKTITTILPSNVKKINIGRNKTSDTFLFNWFIKKGTYKWPGQFRIKISRVGGFPSDMSDVFSIKIDPKVTKYKIYGSVNNQCKRKFWSGKNKTTAHLKKVADKVPCKNSSTTDAWVGYEYRLMHENQSDWVGDVFRSFVYFDVSHLQGKGVVLSAKLHYMKTYVTSGPNCKISIYKVNSVWANAFNVNAEFVSSNPKNSELKTYVWSWIGHPGDNHGLMFVGPDESFQHITAKCRAILSNIYIEVEFLE